MTSVSVQGSKYISGIDFYLSNSPGKIEKSSAMCVSRLLLLYPTLERIHQISIFRDTSTSKPDIKYVRSTL
jgi:hypothetical protein